MTTANNSYNSQMHDSKILSFIVSAVFILCLYILPAKLFAETANTQILIVYQKTQGYSLQLIENLQKNLSTHGYNSHKMMLTSKNTIGALELLDIKKYTLLIPIGSQPTKLILEKNIKKPILSALIPRHIFKSLQKKYPLKKNWSGLLINQPIDRQFHLISTLLGKNKNTAVLLGPYTKDLSRALKNISNSTSHHINVEEIKRSEQLSKSLSILDHSVDVLLTLPDPVVYNKNTIREILFSAYRNKLPIIGFSRSYVKAGAIAAIYSKPEQISDQIVSIVNSYFKNKKFSQKQYYPDEFSVALNKNIARSLGIKLEPNSIIIKKIKKAEANK